MDTYHYDAGRVLFGKTRRRVMGWLFSHPDEAFYLRQIVRQTGAGQGAVQRELHALTRAGMVERRVQGRQVYFQANRHSAIFTELQSLLLKTAGAAGILREALGPFGSRVVLALIFGSTARGELRRGSDIDLLVVGDVPFAEVVNALSAAQARLGRDVNPVVYPAAEFRSRIRRDHPFLSRVLSEPRLFIIGGPDELGGLGTQRMAGSSQDQSKRNSRTARRRGPGSRRQRG